jgi:hypothetical protein
LHRLIRHLALAVTLVATMWIAPVALAATLTADTQKAVRAATFEVVLRKPDTDTLTYEKPLPLDLIPFVIRNDHYWSIGTAFAVAPDTYVSAAHVLLATVGSEHGAPALRDGAGHVYPIDRVLKLSVDKDFAVFTVTGAPPAVPLPVSSTHTIDDTVFAVGNALGEGVVVRDGLLTSETPEDQDGRWKWLRFSAAASPGNSGGPLLDASGRVIGIVLAKSPNENLNYALPLQMALEAPQQTSVDLRYSVRLPYARQAQVSTLKAELPLPKPFADFAKEYRELRRKTTQRDRELVQGALADQLFPRGRSGKLLAMVYSSPLPTFVQEDSGDAWDIIAPDNTVSQDLPDRGLVAVGDSLGARVFRVRRPGGASDAAFYHDPGPFMDMVLKGLKLPRQVGNQEIRVTSLGRAPQQRTLEDSQGRRWQVTSWSLGHADSYLLCYALPTPEGYVGMVGVAPASEQEALDSYLGELTDVLYVSYSGTLAQWLAFLSRPELRPRAFDHLTLALDDRQVNFRSPRLALQIPRDLAGFSAGSELTLNMTYLLEGKKLSWDIGGVYLYKDPDEHTFVGVSRHPKPREDASHDVLETWEQMRTHGPGFNRIAGHDPEFKSYWIHDSVSAPVLQNPGLDPDAAVLYDVFYSTSTSAYPQDLEEAERRLIQGTRVLER